jgi:hypothetical protein
VKGKAEFVSVRVEGFEEQVAFAGAPVQVRVTVPENPFTGLI